MTSMDSLLPLGEVTGRLRILGQSYVGVRSIPVERIVGSVDRSVDFDRCFRPRRPELKKRINDLREVFGSRPMPPITAYEAGSLYFVSDGHHRVALAREDGAQFIDAEVTALRLSHEIHPKVDLLELIHTEQYRRFVDQTELLVRHPEAVIEFSRPIGYSEMAGLIEAHAYELSRARGELVPIADATADWYENSWLPAQEAITASKLRERYWFKTPGDLYLWVSSKLREMRTLDRTAGWHVAAAARAAEPVDRSHAEIARRERRVPLPARAIAAAT
jgi:hypothetical protein